MGKQFHMFMSDDDFLREHVESNESEFKFKVHCGKGQHRFRLRTRDSFIECSACPLEPFVFDLIYPRVTGCDLHPDDNKRANLALLIRSE